MLTMAIINNKVVNIGMGSKFVLMGRSRPPSWHQAGRECKPKIGLHHPCEWQRAEIPEIRQLLPSRASAALIGPAAQLPPTAARLDVPWREQEFHPIPASRPVVGFLPCR